MAFHRYLWRARLSPPIDHTMRCSAMLPLLVLVIIFVPRLAAVEATASAPSTSAGALSISAGGPSMSIPADPFLPCLEDVLPCTAYLNSTGRPSRTCCTALNRASATEMPCLCWLLADPAMLATFSVTKEQMLALPTRCSLPVGCRLSGGSDPVVEAPPPPTVPTTRRGGVPSSGDRCRSSVGWRVIASVVLGGLVKIAAVF